MEQGWQRLANRIDLVLRDMRWGSFLILDFDRSRHGDGCPYVQAAPCPAGWYAEVTSSHYLDPGVALTDEVWLAGAGWQPPNADTRNWWRAGVAGDEILTVLLEGLRRGLECTDPDRVSHTIGRFPDGPRGGEPKPADADLGCIRTAAA